LKRILHGLSCRQYEKYAEAVPEVFGLNGSTVLRRYIRASARELKRLCERQLGGYDFVVLILDGKIFGADKIVMALGITVEGRKIPLGFIKTGAENERVCREMLEGLLERDMRNRGGGFMCHRWIERAEENDLWGVWEQSFAPAMPVT
jgi:transposase-like protein